MPEIISTLSTPSANLKTLLEATGLSMKFRQHMSWSKTDLDNVMAGLAIMTSDEHIQASTFFGLTRHELTTDNPDWSSAAGASSLMAEFIKNTYLDDIATQMYHNLHSLYTSDATRRLDQEIKQHASHDRYGGIDELRIERAKTFSRDLLSTFSAKNTFVAPVLDRIAEILGVPVFVLWKLDKQAVTTYRKMRRSLEVTQRKQESIIREVAEYNERLANGLRDLDSLGPNAREEFSDIGIVAEPHTLHIELRPFAPGD